MIESAYRIPKNVPRPRSSVLVTQEDKGAFYNDTPKCKVWADAQTLGMELRWTTEYTLTVTNDNGKPAFNFLAKSEDLVSLEPIGQHYYGLRTGQHISFPRGLGGLVLPHPRFFDPVPDGCYNDTPAIVPGFVQLDWWPRGLFVVASIPKPGTEHIFHAGEPFCQIIPVPIGEMVIRPLTDDETQTWEERDKFFSRLASEGENYESIAGQIRKIGWKGLAEKYPEASK